MKPWQDVLTRYLLGEASREELDAARAGLPPAEAAELDELLQLDAAVAGLLDEITTPALDPVLERVRDEPLPPQEDPVRELLDLVQPPAGGLEQVLETVRAEFEAHAAGRVFTASDELRAEDGGELIRFPAPPARDERVLAAGKEVRPPTDGDGDGDGDEAGDDEGAPGHSEDAGDAGDEPDGSRRG